MNLSKNLNKKSILFLFVLGIIFTNKPTVSALDQGSEPCPHPDYNALMSLYDNTDGPNWNDNSGWADGAAGIDCDPCLWFGVSCNEEGRVTCLDLDGLEGCSNFTINSGNGLNGSLPNAIAGLSELEGLFLEGNENLTGELPAGFYMLEKLESFVILFTGISGSISSDISNLTNLKLFNTGFNSISGTIPEEIGDLVNLESLVIFYSTISGTIPASIGNLENLTELRLNDNNLEGCIPYSFNNLCATQVILSNNPNMIGGGDFSAFCDSGLGSCPEPCSDLIIDITNIELSNNIVSYDYTITNIGEGPADLNGTTTDNFTNVSIQHFLTNDPNPANFPNGQAAGGSIIGSSPLPTLQTGDSYEGNYQANWHNGSYTYLSLQVDWGQRVDECNETNNVVVLEGGCYISDAHNYSPDADFDANNCETCDDGIKNGDETEIDCGGSLCELCDYDDFFIANQYLTKSIVAPGKKFKAKCQQSYLGTSSTTQKVWMRYYWSEDTLLDADDIIMAKDKSTLSINDTYDKEKYRYKVPNNTADGIYYVLFRSDYKEEYDESDESNNIVWASIEVSSQNSNAVDHNSGKYAVAEGVRNIARDLTTLPSEDRSLRNTLTDVNVYPNPFTDKISITLDNKEAEQYRYEVLDINGKLIIQGKIDQKSTDINAQDMHPGFYILRIINSSGHQANIQMIKS